MLAIIVNAINIRYVCEHLVPSENGTMSQILNDVFIYSTKMLIEHLLCPNRGSSISDLLVNEEEKDFLVFRWS